MLTTVNLNQANKDLASAIIVILSRATGVERGIKSTNITTEIEETSDGGGYTYTVKGTFFVPKVKI